MRALTEARWGLRARALLWAVGSAAACTGESEAQLTPNAADGDASRGVSGGSAAPGATADAGSGSSAAGSGSAESPAAARPPGATPGSDVGAPGAGSADAGVLASPEADAPETDPLPAPPAPPAGLVVEYDEEGCPIAPALALRRVATLTQTGMLLVQAPGDSLAFLAERPGRILVLQGGRVLPTPLIDFRDSVAQLETERGLLSMALHPDFPQSGRFFVFYTRAVDDPMTPELSTLGDLVIAEGRLSREDRRLAEPRLTPLVTIEKDVRYHNGGMLAFGPDGYLYASTGEDGRIYGPEASTLQQVNHKLGKILRIDVDAPDLRPPGNIAGADIHVWDYGLRNPWRMSFDRQTGDLYIGDVGEATWDEINYEPAGQGGRNYGWGVLEGSECFRAAGSCDTAGITPPILAIPHDGPGSTGNTCTNDFEAEAAQCNRAVVGGYVYRGPALPELGGRYFYGDNIQNTVRSFIVRDGAAACQQDHTADLVSPETRLQGIVSFSEDGLGELYVLDLFGNVYRIERQ